jgi:hypothetical protein
MERYHIIRDGTIIGSAPTREEAIEMINNHKARETHWLKSEYWLIKGIEEFIK